MSFFSNFSKQLQSGLEEGLKEAQKYTNDLTPIAKRTARLVQEKFGTIEDISELPEEYILLEKKVDALRNAYKKLLTITTTYEIESYDYPPNISESVSDLSKTISEKFQGLQKASNVSEVEKVLNEESSNEPQLPKTLAHELSKASKNAHSLLKKFDQDNSLSKVLLLFSETELKIGNRRIEQDQLIINEFNSKLQDILTKNFQETQLNRKNVENARLNFDTLRYELKLNPARQEELQEKLDQSEDDLVNATSVAVQSMEKLIKPAESVNLIVLFSKIQLEYFKSATAELESLVKNLESIPIEDEDDEDEDETEASEEAS
ncbi:Meiotically up-regulated protein [Wickerhamomyces ciferrii]|uniref:Meiotically up-regulated protein n=1 Tax=Wickerhamomyces ciferrii (strain ATCC 14091 / BCRC 22168 / CBS 111 / JCM 3599 / NBRC 0793 / NRRL Y-1031 F-60-10) TaxID=1206466 RepID=K0KUJ8_WICCF|nr:Meiotically up-regulated protein [Wickerhamomyces ciferrii]CCH45104.1 Meiotically up-regulated protein [Wickerhamomyces ciferrii]